MKVKNSRIKILCITIVLMFALQGCGESKDAYKIALQGGWITNDEIVFRDENIKYMLIGTAKDCTVHIVPYSNGEEEQFRYDEGLHQFDKNEFLSIYQGYKCEMYPDDEHSGGINIITGGRIYKVEYNFKSNDILYLSGDIEGKFERIHE